MRTFSSANVSEDVSDSRAHSESHRVLQISIFPVHVCYCSWTNDAETERRAVVNQYKRLTLLWPKLQACFGNTERMQSKQSWKPFYSQAKTQFFQLGVFQIFHNTDTWSPKPRSRPLIFAWKTIFTPTKQGICALLHIISSIWSSTPVSWPGSWSAPFNFTPLER